MFHCILLNIPDSLLKEKQSEEVPGFQYFLMFNRKIIAQYEI